MKKFIGTAALTLLTLLSSCGGNASKSQPAVAADSTMTAIKHPEWSRNAVIYEVNLRQFTDSGTVTAFDAHLPRLKKLGVDILWFMPVYPISQEGKKGELGSYYAVADYKGFNPEFGTVEQFKETVKKAHGQGMKVILDWVPNHTGRDNAWVKEHPDWYQRDSLGNMYGPFDWTDVYQLDYSNPQMRAAMIDAMRYWVKEVGVDGFRCDVAGMVPVDFWNTATASLRSDNPELFMLAEASEPALQKHAFDMGYNWPMKDLFSEIAATAGQYSFKDASGKMKKFPVKTAVAIDSLLAVQAEQYPGDTYMMNMITNHDLNSWEGTEFERLGNLADAFAVLSYTLPGMPLIYTGQETGMNRALEFFKKDAAPDWEPQNKYFKFYQILNNLKHTEPALLAGSRGGDMKRYPTTDDRLYVFSREGRTVQSSTVLVAVNLSSETLPLTFTGEAPAIKPDCTDVFEGEVVKSLPAELRPGEYKVFLNGPDIQW